MTRIDFRNYEDGEFQGRVERTYHAMQTQQTVEYVRREKSKVREITRDIWDTFALLEQVVDESDPDNDLPQTVHAFQTAESVRSRYINTDGSMKDVRVRMLFRDDEWLALPDAVRTRYEAAENLRALYSNLSDWRWFPLIGFIHDLGKVLALPEFGGLPQWSVVGDTFPVGCAFHPSNVMFSKGFHKGNPDWLAASPYVDELGMYTAGCGLDRLLMSWGHDEYLAGVLSRNANTLPREAIYIIRYHSFYPWHTPEEGKERAYTNLASDDDWHMLPLVKALQKSDLYSKTRDVPPMEDIKREYSQLLDVYFASPLLKW